MKELADAKAENDVMMMLPLVVVVVHQSSLSVSAKPLLPPADNAASPTGRHRWNGIISPQREADHYAKTMKEPRSILMSSADRVAHIDGQLIQLLRAIHTRFQRSINA